MMYQMRPVEAYIQGLKDNPYWVSMKPAFKRIWAKQNDITHLIILEILKAPKLELNLIIQIFGKTGTGKSMIASYIAWLWSKAHKVNFDESNIYPNFVEVKRAIDIREKNGTAYFAIYINDEKKDIWGQGKKRIESQYANIIDHFRERRNLYEILGVELIPVPCHFAIEALGDIDRETNSARALVYDIEVKKDGSVERTPIGYAVFSLPPEKIIKHYKKAKQENIKKVSTGEKTFEIDAMDYARKAIKHHQWAEGGKDTRLYLIEHYICPELTGGEYRHIYGLAMDIWAKELKKIREKEESESRDYAEKIVNRIRELNETKKWGRKKIAKELKLQERFVRNVIEGNEDIDKFIKQKNKLNKGLE